MTSRTNANRPEPEGTVRAGYDPANELWEYINPDGTPDEAMVKRVIDAIVATVQPERIILFGSAARGEMHENSDLDFLVVKKGCESARRRTTGRTAHRLRCAKKYDALDDPRVLCENAHTGPVWSRNKKAEEPSGAGTESVRRAGRLRGPARCVEDEAAGGAVERCVRSS